MSGKAEVVEVNRTDQIAEFESDWDRLHSLHSPSNLFLSRDWLQTWWKHFGNTRKLCMLVLRDGRAVRAIAPLCQGKVGAGMFRTTRTEFIASEISDALEFLHDPKRPEDSALLLRAALRRYGANGWLHLKKVKPGSILEEIGEREARASHCRLIRHPYEPNPYLPIEGKFKEIIRAQGSGRRRRRIHAKEKRLRNSGKLEYYRLQNESELESSLKEVFALSDLSSRAGKGKNVFACEPRRDFFRDVAPILFERGWLDLFILRVGGKPVAYTLGFQSGKVFRGYAKAYDPAYYRLSPGLLIDYRLLEVFFEEEFKEIDFSAGIDQAKAIWTDHYRTIHEMHFIPGGVGFYGLFSLFVWARAQYKTDYVLKRLAHERVL